MFRPENFVAILTAILVYFFCLLNHSWYKEMGWFVVCLGIYTKIYILHIPKTLAKIFSLVEKLFIFQVAQQFSKSKDSQEAYSDPLRKGHRRS